MSNRIKGRKTLEFAQWETLVKTYKLSTLGFYWLVFNRTLSIYKLYVLFFRLNKSPFGVNLKKNSLKQVLLLFHYYLFQNVFLMAT